MSEDRKQIGLTVSGQEIVTKLTDELGWFDEALAAGRFAFSYAVSAGIQGERTAAPVDTRWSADSFDPSGEIRTILRALYPETSTPIRHLEFLIDAGLEEIASAIENGTVDPTSFFD